MSSLGSQWRVLRHYLSLTNLNAEVEKLVQKLKPSSPEQWDQLIKKFENVVTTKLKETDQIKSQHVVRASATVEGTSETKNLEKSEKTEEKTTQEGLPVGSEITFDSLLQGLKLKKDLHFGKISENSWKANKPIVTKTSIHSRTAYVISALVTAETGECARRRAEHFIDHLHQYPEARDYAIKEGAVRALLRVRNKLKGDEAITKEVNGIVNEALALVGYTPVPGGRGPRILSLDGGGIRGVIAIELLRHLERATGRRVHDLFDYIVGVSTGAIIAAVIGSGVGTLETANEMYMTLSKKMFGNTSVIGGTSRLVWTHSYYDTDAWEKLLQENLGDLTLTQCNRQNTPKMALVSCVVNAGSRLSPFLFRSYECGFRVRSVFPGTARARLWHAVRASAAAPTYFDEFRLDGLLHQDGGIMVNNPTGVGLDRDLAKEGAFIQDWLSPALSQDIEEAACQMRESLTEVCDFSMPRSRRPDPRHAIYWWTEEIAGLRAACFAARRRYTNARRRRRRDLEREARLYEAFVEARKAVKAAIGAAKDSARQEMLEGLDRDPWGRPYKAARSQLRPIGPPLTETLQPELLEEVVAGLFPARDRSFSPPLMAPPPGDSASNESAAVITTEEFGAAEIVLRGKKTAPGPDGVPAKVLALAMGEMESRVRGLFNRCLEVGRFPKLWKRGQLCLLKKVGRPADSPSAYRPIILLDEIGKTFERIVSSRLVEHLRQVGDLSEAQYGFRSGRSTIDALTRLRQLTDEAASAGEGVIAVSFDIKNAFNSLPHAVILEALRYFRVPQYLQDLLRCYLEDREVLYVNKSGELRSHQVESGVPQGSVLGPLLWNVGYDWLLRGRLLPGMSVICYADDTLVTARGRSFEEAAIRASAGGDLVVKRIKLLGLEVALQKTEAIYFPPPRSRFPPSASIVVGGCTVQVKPEMKYLGLILDARWHFGPHFRGMLPRLLKAADSFGWLLPNLGGPSAKCRRLYAGILRSMALYGSPIWASSLERRENVALLRAPQRAIAQRVARAYRTVGFSAACVLAGTPPWEEEAGVLAAVYEWTAARKASGEPYCLVEKEAVRKQANQELVLRWTESLDSVQFGRRTIEAIAPVLDRWLSRQHGFLSFRMVQVLTGHGCFGSYLHRIQREEASVCHECGAPEDTAQHTLAECRTWGPQREALVRVVGSDLALPTVVRAMLASEEAFTAFASFCEDVISQKEEAERLREQDPRSSARRRARRGGRRRTVARHLPQLPRGGQSAAGAGAPVSALHRSPLQPGRDGSVLPAAPITPPTPSGGSSVGPAL